MLLNVTGEGVLQRKLQRVVTFVYIKQILFAILLISPIAAYHAYRYHDGGDYQFYLIPIVISLVFGSLLGRAVLLKQRLLQQGEQFRAIADLAHEFTYYRRVDGRYEYVSPACYSMTGYDQDDFYKTPNLMDLIIHPDDSDRWKEHVHAINDGGEPESFEIRLITRDGRIVWFKHICAAVYDDKGKHIGVRSTNLDITQQKEDEARIEHMAYYDPLTELPNRRSLVNRIRAHIGNSLTAEEKFALLFFDINRFKHINDSFGHNFGDRMLKMIAIRLQGACQHRCMVTRFGGDEFVIMLMGVDSKAVAQKIARRLLRVIEEPLVLDGIDLHVSAGVGISFYPADGADEDTLIRNADVAMYKTKRENGGNIRCYSVDFSEEAERFISTESKLQRGLFNKEFTAVYQPKVDMLSGRIVGLEALARWRHPKQGMLSPADFIPVAEETGQIKEVGKQIFEQVIRDVRRWRELGVAMPVAVNVSARQFADHDFYHDLIETIRDSGCPPSLIELEITEQVFLGDLNFATERLLKLREAGLSIALDDFGTGYSSFTYIKELPIDTLKIDRSFITHIDTDKVEYAIIKALVSMCRDLQLGMVVEGVETSFQKRSLVELGCSKAQGFYFYRPMPTEGVEAMLLGQQEHQSTNFGSRNE
ncbi:MAG: EAL domain-containing protein [Pseudomonadota bacterium]